MSGWPAELGVKISTLPIVNVSYVANVAEDNEERMLKKPTVNYRYTQPTPFTLRRHRSYIWRQPASLSETVFRAWRAIA